MTFFPSFFSVSYSEQYNILILNIEMNFELLKPIYHSTYQFNLNKRNRNNLSIKELSISRIQFPVFYFLFKIFVPIEIRFFIFHIFLLFLGERANFVNKPHVIAMVGLPARGKTYISKKLCRYLNWIGISTKVFNLGEYRRHATTAYQCHEFFRPDNIKAMAIRTQCAKDALNDVCQWLESGDGEVAVFDATNSTVERRQLIRDIVVRKMGFNLFFVESVCNDPEIVEQNIMEVCIEICMEVCMEVCT